MSIRDITLSTQEKLKHELKNLDFVTSATLIGMPLEERIVESINDLDTVIVVYDKMSEKKYEKIKEIFENLRNSTKPYVDFQYAIADGPMKPISEKGHEIFYHVIFHTEESYKQSPLIIVENSWQYEKPFLGKPLKEIRKISGIDKTMLVDGSLGINHLIDLVKKNESAYLDWEKDTTDIMKMKLFPLKFKEIDERLELYFYSILRCASNTLRYFTGDNLIGINLNMCALFENICKDFKYVNLPRETYANKRLLRNKKLILPESFALSYQNKTIDFLENLKQYINKKSNNKITQNNNIIII